MIITLCGSIAHIDRMIECQKILQMAGHVVHIPAYVPKDQDGNTMTPKEFYRIRKSGNMDVSWFEEEKAKAMRRHFDLIAGSDAILVVNEEKNNIAGYIGGNTLMEMGLAFHLKKKIYLLQAIPELSYKEEIIGMRPVILGGDINKIG